MAHNLVDMRSVRLPVPPSIVMRVRELAADKMEFSIGALVDIVFLHL